MNFRGDDEAFGLTLPGVLLETSNVTDKTSVRRTFTAPPLTAIMIYIYIYIYILLADATSAIPLGIPT